jgi:hypothetical protein
MLLSVCCTNYIVGVHVGAMYYLARMVIGMIEVYDMKLCRDLKDILTTIKALVHTIKCKAPICVGRIEKLYSK